jgi:hypothetical protein
MADLGKLTSVQLRARRRRLAARLSDPQTVLMGSLVTQSRRCGKPGCRCTEGAEHGPYTYLSARVGGGTRLRYVTAALLKVVRRRVKQTEVFESVIAEISAINLELLARRELD